MINLIILFFMFILISLSETLDKRQKTGLLRSFFLTALLCTAEHISLRLDGSADKWRILHIGVCMLRFGLSPCIAIFLVQAIDKKRDIRPALIIAAAYFVFTVATLPTGLIFRVDANNSFHRGTWFPIYVGAFLCSILFLLLSTVITGKRHQNRGKLLAYPIALFLFFGITVQLRYPEIHISWLCITLLSMLYFIYCNEMWQQVDGLTGLLSQKSYLNRTATMDQTALLIVFDVDDFKSVNDEFGHLKGDEVLIDIAECIRQAYSNFGYCYRIGGDEFCVLLKFPGIQLPCYANFLRALQEKRAQKPMIPYVSIGTAVFSRGDNILAVKEKADQELYAYKEKHKIDRANGKYDDGSLYAHTTFF